LDSKDPFVDKLDHAGRSDLVIAHWASFTPLKSGLYETVKELVQEENRTDGVIAGICDPGDPKGGKVDRSTDPHCVSQSHDWAFRDAKVHMIHSSSADILSRLKPIVFFLHGCFWKHQRITVADGSRKELCSLKVNDLLPSFNEDTGKIEHKHIVFVGPNGRSNSWLKIETEFGPKEFCTNDHPFYLENGKEIPAMELKRGDKLRACRPVLTELQKEIIFGAELGDASFGHAGFRTGHKIEHSDFHDLLAACFQGFNVKRKEVVSGFGTKMEVMTINLGQRFHFLSKLNPFKGIEAILKSNGKKRINKEWLQGLSWVSLGIFFLDDGSLTHFADYKKQDGTITTGKCGIGFSVCGFSLEEVESLSECLRIRFGLENKVSNYNSYPRISINKKDDVQHFFKGVLSVLPIPRSFWYKIPDEFHGMIRGDTLSDKLSFSTLSNTVISCEPWKRVGKKGFTRWALTVEDNGNYFAGLNLVHNSPEACIWSEEEFWDKGFSMTSSFRFLELSEAMIVFMKRHKFFYDKFDESGKVRLVSKGVDLERWKPEGSKMNFKGKPNVLFGEVWREIKDPFVTFYALDLYFEKNREMQFHPWALADKRYLWEQIATKGQFTKLLGPYGLSGPQAYPEHWYRGGDLLISPVTTGEPSRVSQEALGCGCPTISWDTDNFGDNYSIRKVRPFDPHALAEGIEDLWEEIQSGPEEMRSRCRKIAEEHYDMKVMTKQVLEVVKEVANRK